jgi:hypothetical protein
VSAKDFMQYADVKRQLNRSPSRFPTWTHGGNEPKEFQWKHKVRKSAFQKRIAAMQLRKTAETTARNAERRYNGMGGK